MPNAVIEIEKHRGMDSTCESIRSDIELCIEAGQFVEAIQLMRQCPKQVESFMSDELLPVLKICYGLMNQIQEFSPKPNKGLSPRSHEQDFAAGPAIIAGCIKQVKILIEGAKVRSLHEAKAEEPDALDDAVTENNPTPLQYFTESLFYTKQSFWVVLNELTKLWTLVFGKAGNAEKRFDGVRQLIEEGKFEAALSEITKFVYDIDRIIKQRRQFILQTKMIIDALPFFIKRVLVKHAPLLVEALEEIRLVEEGALPSQGLVEKIGQELLKLWSTLDLVEIKNREDRHKEKWRISLNTILQDKIQQGALLDSSPKDRQEVEVKASLEDISNVDFGQLIQGLLEREAYASAQFLLKLTPLRDHFGHSLEEVLVELGANHNDEETYQHISHVYHEHQCEQVERLISEILNAIGQRVSFRELEDQFERKMRRINDYHTALPEELKNRYLSAVAAMSSYLNSLRNEGAVAMDEPSKEASLIKEINEFLSPLAVADAKEPDNAGEVVTGLVQAKKLIAQYRELLEKKAQAGSDLPDNQELYQSVGSLLEYLSEKYSEACVDSNKNLLRVVVAPLEVLEHLYKKNLLQAAVVQSRILLELGDMFFVLDQMEEDKNIDFDLPENAHSQLHGLLLQKLESILGTAYKWPLSFLADDSLYGCINLLMILASENPNSENTVRLMTWICTKNFSSLQAVEAFMRLGNMKAAVDLLQCYSAKASCQEFNRVCEALMDEIEGFLGSVDDSKSDGIAEKLPDIEILVAKYQAFRQIRQNFSHQEPIVQKFYQYLQNAYKELYDACLTSLMREKNLIKILDDFIKLQQIVMAITRLGQVDIAVPSPSGLDSLLFDMGKAFEHHQNEFEFLVSTRRYGCLKKLLEADKNGHQNSLTKLIREGNTQVLDAIDAFVCSENNDVANDILESVHSPTDQISVHKLLFDIEGFSRLGTAGEGRGVTLDPSWIKDVAQDIAEAKKLAIRCQALRRALNDPPEIFFDYLHKKHRETLDYTIALCNDRNNNLSPVTPMQILDGLIVLDEIALIFQRMRRKEGAALALPAILSDAALAHGLQSDIHPKYANCIEALVSAKRYGCMKLLREWHLNIMGDQENAERKIATLQGLVQSRDSRTLDALEAFARSENKGAVENVLHFVAKADKNMPPVRNILSRMLLSPLPARSRAGSLCGLSAVPQIAVKQSPNARRSSCA
ncbi:MAG: hypothetical protein K0Q74_1284 [Gammaproteobacteria bacterium]|nr:hypothetical protein [Gammaproteobacteria bacterium]